jgi:integrase
MKRRSNGEGTLLKRKDGRWMAQAYVTLVNGERKRICVTAKSHETVKVKLREIIEQENRHVPYIEKDWTVGEYLDYWMKEVQVNRIRETTYDLYDRMIKKHIKPVISGQKLKALSVHDIRNSLNQLGKRGASNRTCIECMRILSACLNCAMREELIYRNVAQLAEKPKHTPKEAVIWTAEQAALFLEKTKNHPLYTAFLLFLTYGMRRGEVLVFLSSEKPASHYS